MAADPSGAEEEPVIDVMGTVLDHDYLKTPFGKIYLPRIFYWEDASGQTHLNAYGSTKKAEQSELFELAESGAIVPSGGGHILIDMSITSHLAFVWFSVIIVMIVTFIVAGKYKRGVGKETEPKGAFQNIFEILFEFIRDHVAKDNIPDHKYKRYVPYLFAVFTSIALMNLFGLLPWAATATADLTVTATLAAISFFVIQFSGTKDHWAHVFWFPGVPGWSRIILTPVEILGLFTKPFALAIRLFANMLSGKMMIIAILGLIFIFADLFGPVGGYGMAGFLAVPLTAAIYFLKAFVALLQAYVFTILTAVFIGMAAEDHEHDEEGYHVEHVAEAE
ncbi:F0F1 ATP synthase subunit A [Gracilimonas mengyeensis]|uniref:F0F1 ATP synthase subunit A n=1 Tax=Gracilimonas mengyeensis TaxID=1302730 RepID=UPI001FE35ED4|nr:F0F1 ATP synthase subunit A [Gracilimonas mengyeensis]